MKWIGQRSYYDRLEEMAQPGRAALLVIDQQNDFTHLEGYYERRGIDTSMARAVTPRINQLTSAARALGIPVVFTRNIVARDFSSDSPVWLAQHATVGLESLQQEDFYTIQGSWGAEVHDEIQTDPGDQYVDKYRATAFHNTTLDTLLRSQGIETVICTGQVTQGCVDNTVRNARDRDYYTILVSDAVASTNLEMHEHTLNVWRARIPVPTTDEMLEVWMKFGKTDSEESRRV